MKVVTIYHLPSGNKYSSSDPEDVELARKGLFSDYASTAAIRLKTRKGFILLPKAVLDQSSIRLEDINEN